MTRREREARQLRQRLQSAGLSQGQAAAALSRSIRHINGQLSGREDIDRATQLALLHTPVEILRQLAGLTAEPSTAK